MVGVVVLHADASRYERRADVFVVIGFHVEFRAVNLYFGRLRFDHEFAFGVFGHVEVAFAVEHHAALLAGKLGRVAQVGVGVEPYARVVGKGDGTDHARCGADFDHAVVFVSHLHQQIGRQAD